MCLEMKQINSIVSVRLHMKGTTPCIRIKCEDESGMDYPLNEVGNPFSEKRLAFLKHADDLIKDKLVELFTGKEEKETKETKEHKTPKETKAKVITSDSFKQG